MDPDNSERVGVVTGGPHIGMYVKVEQDRTGTGWHIWLLMRHPREGASEGWDIWADDLDQVNEWFQTDLPVNWLE